MGWTESYNCHSYVVIPKVMTISVDWGSSDNKSTGFRVSIGDRRLKNLVGDLPRAKVAGLLFAKRLLAEMTKSIEELEKEISNEGV